VASIDNRIVQMQFDNAAFERKLSTTVQSIDKLNATLSNAGAKNGLQNVADSVKNFSLGSLSASIDGISGRFLAMSTIAITALSNIVNRAVTAGIQMTKALSLDQVTGGFGEYELQIGSIQTILANTSADGTNLEQVSAALDQLNTYADQTIYNFADMTRSIGTFTAAGVGLDLSVQSIKGIANLAAISGSTSEQASTAMYQLSQAISTGSVRLMDWNSVVNAGMGGEVFQKALFATGQAMGTITNSPMGQTFEEWTAAGNIFRTSLDEGWLTAEVLTTTLQGFTGEMTEAQLTALGFSQQQAAEMIRLGELGVDSATKVRTLSQLMTTVKESISSGWASSFRLIFGDFDEATELFTGMSNALGEMFGNSANARNALLQGWADMGGRVLIIEGLKNAWYALGNIVRPIKDAFRDIFPAKTSGDLLSLSVRFHEFTESLIISQPTIDKVRAVFRGLFSALEIGWTVIKEGVGFIKDLFSSFTAGSGSAIFDFLKRLGDMLTYLNVSLILEGGIAAFFDDLAAKIQPAVVWLKAAVAAVIEFVKGLDVIEKAKAVLEFIKGLGSAVKDFFSDLRGGGLDAAGDAVGSFSDKFAGLRERLGQVGNIWEPLKKALGGIGDILDNVWDTLKDWFGGLGEALAGVFSTGDFDSTLDTINTGLFGGILLLIAKFLKGGINFDFGGGFFKNISDVLGELSGTLKAMQMDLKANALLKIAGAIGILAVSLILLATMDSEALTRALTAMGVGFGQLVAVIGLLDQIITGPRQAASIALVAGSLILLAGSVLILSVAMKLLSTMSWEELSKGLVGVGGALLLLVGAAFILSKTSGSMIRIGIGLMAVALALGIMAGAVKLFSMMEWDELLKGLAGVGGALVALAIGMNLMPKGMLAQGAGLILVGAALNIIVLAVKSFADMSWKDMAKGLVGVSGALVGIGIAMRLMPATMPLIGLGLLMVSGALLIIGKAMENISQLSWGEIAKGLVGISGALIGIGIAMAIASQGLLGAAALTVMVFAIRMLVDVLKDVSALSWGDLLKGFVAIAGGLAVLGLAALALSPVLPSLFLLGAALTLIGAGFALFGAGVMAVAKGFEILARVGKAGAKAIGDAMKAVAENLPEFLKSIAKGVTEMIQEFLKGMGPVIEELGIVVGKILDALIDLVPKAAELVRTLVTEMLSTIRELFPQFVETGFELITAFLTGVRDNIGEIVTLVADIITNFLDAMTVKIPEVIDSMYNFFVAVIEGVAAKLVDVGQILVPKGLELIQGLLKGLDDSKDEIGNFFLRLPGLILGWIGNALTWLVSTGVDLIAGLYNAASDFVTGTLVPWLSDLPGNMFSWIGDTISTLSVRGTNLIIGFLNAASSYVTSSLIPWLGSLPGKMFSWIGDTISTLSVRGTNLIIGFLNAASSYVSSSLIPWLGSLPGKIFGWVGDTIGTLGLRGANLIVGLLNGIIGSINSNLIPWLSGMPGKIVDWVNLSNHTLFQIGKDLIQGLWNGIKTVWDQMTGWVGNAAGGVTNILRKVWDLFSPSRVTMEIGEYLVEGLYIGMKDQWKTVDKWLNNLDPVTAMQSYSDRMVSVITQAASSLDGMSEFNPTITPVLDLTLVRNGAKALSGMLPVNSSYLQAAGIASTSRPIEDPTALSNAQTGPSEIKFEQIINAPKQLSTGDIYKNTRNQIALAKEELSIP